MSAEERVRRAIFEALDEVNLTLPEGERISKNAGVVLVGQDGSLDSLGLINFVVAAEQKLLDEFKTAVSLTDLVMTQDQSRYRTIGALCEMVTKMMEAQLRGA